jgi:CheY-like chemotaxis protein
MADVLVVDDDPDIRTLLTLALELGGHRVDTCDGGDAALAELRHQAAAGTALPTVVLDLQMPERDGIDVLLDLRADPAICDAPVILCTVRAGPSDLDRGWSAGCDAYQAKPFDIAQVTRTVSELSATAPDELRRRRDERRGGAVAR